MKSPDPLDPQTPNATGSELIRRAFSLGLHGSTQAVAAALCISADTASRLLSPTRRDGRDPTHGEVGAFVELLGVRDLLRICASMEGATVSFPDAATVDATTGAATATALAAALVQELVKIDADGKRTSREQSDAARAISAVEAELARARSAVLAWKVTA